MNGPVEQDAPPAGEEIHLSGPSLLPILCAAGLTLSIVGITVGLAFLIPGIALFLYCALRWIGDTRRDIAQLPPEHR
jgi:hypothetical protein